ncbi:MAG: VWA domain-containing protein [Planctomycetaceae bacterium]|nr:VWA domain-containing protein [Planctomycetaceae bacterium]
MSTPHIAREIAGWSQGLGIGRRGLSWLVMVAAALWSVAASAQGVLVAVDPQEPARLPRPILPPHPQPVPVQTYKIKEIDVRAALAQQVAKVQVSQTFVNTGSRAMEVAFLFPLPYDGAIDRLTLMVDGKEIPAKLLSKEEARRRYEEIVRQNQDPALLEWIGAGMFQTSVFPVPPGAERKVTLRYSQLCRQDRGLTDFLFPLSTAKYTSTPVEKVAIEVAIESSTDIKNVYSPTHQVEVKRPDGLHATVTYKAENQVPASDFRLLYDAEGGKVGASVLSYKPKGDEAGFFLLLATPEVKPAEGEPLAKTVIFVVDRSGSMSGEKIEQAKNALKFVLNNLRAGDTFNIVAYDSEIQTFRPELQKYDETTRGAALGFVEGLFAGGSTNIDGALQTALGQLTDNSRPAYIIFLTDGLPTDGEKNEAKIAVNAHEANRVRARMFAFGVGYDVNSRLLDRLSRENFGLSEYVRPNENIEAHVSRLYNRIGSPVLTEVALKFEFDGAPPESGDRVSRVYPRGSFDLFAGEQLVVVGRYQQAGTGKVVITGSNAGQQEKLEFPVELTAASADETYAFVEKLWAVRRVGEIIDEIDLKGKNDELVKELVELSTRHGILTPYTSFLADETSDPRKLAENATQAGRGLERLYEAGGQEGFAQRVAKGALQQAVTAPALGEARYSDLATGQSVAVQTVRNIGAKTFYCRDGQWRDAACQVEPRDAIRVTQFSPEYFKLAEAHGRTVSQYLVFDEPVLLQIEEKCYLIEPPAK